MIYLRSCWSRIFYSTMRVVKDDEREYCVSDNNCLKCVVLKIDNRETLFFCISTESSGKILAFINNEKKPRLNLRGQYFFIY